IVVHPPPLPPPASKFTLPGKGPGRKGKPRPATPAHCAHRSIPVSCLSTSVSGDADHAPSCLSDKAYPPSRHGRKSSPWLSNVLPLSPAQAQRPPWHQNAQREPTRRPAPAPESGYKRLKILSLSTCAYGGGEAPQRGAVAPCRVNCC